MKSNPRVVLRCVAGLLIAACAVQAAHGQWRLRGRRAIQWRRAAVPIAWSQATSPSKFEGKQRESGSSTLRPPIQAQYWIPTAPAPVPRAAPNTAPAPTRMPAAAPRTAARVTHPPSRLPIRYGRSTINFDNQSGQPALVRLMGPTRAEVFVPNNGRNAINRVAAGHYVIRVRYGTEGNYRYTEGDHFDVRGSGTSYSRVTITLHGVASGNYSMHGSTAADFAAAAR